MKWICDQCGDLAPEDDCVVTPTYGTVCSVCADILVFDTLKEADDEG